MQITLSPPRGSTAHRAQRAFFFSFYPASLRHKEAFAKERVQKKLTVVTSASISLPFHSNQTPSSQSLPVFYYFCR